MYTTDMVGTYLLGRRTTASILDVLINRSRRTFSSASCGENALLYDREDCISCYDLHFSLYVDLTTTEITGQIQNAVT